MIRTRRGLRSVTTTVIVFVIAGGLAACGQMKNSTGGDPSVITREQIQEAGTTSNAYLLVQRLHPNWLQKRGANSLVNTSNIMVYVEGSRRGGAESLRNVQVIHVERIEYLRPQEATLEYGSGHDHGAIRVELRES